MKKVSLIIFSLIFSTIAFGSIKTIRKIKYITPSSFTCYEDTNSSKSNISFYVGEYVLNADGTKIFNYYKSTDSLNMFSNEICKKMKIDYRVLGDVTNEQKWTTLFIDENDFVVGYESPLSKDLVLLNY